MKAQAGTLHTLALFLAAFSLASAPGFVRAQTVQVVTSATVSHHGHGYGKKPKPTPAPAPVVDAQRVWNNTGTNFNAGGSWVGGTAPVAGDVAAFNAAAVTQPQLNANTSISGLYFTGTGTNGYTLTRTGTPTLTLTGYATSIGAETGDVDAVAIGAENTSGTNTVSVPFTLAPAVGSTSTIFQAGGGTLVLSGAIAGSGINLTKTGTGTLTLSGNNTFTGVLTVQAGTLSIPTITNANTAGPLGLSTANAVVLGGSGTTGTLEYTGGTASSTKKFTMATGGTGVFQVDTAATTLTLSGLIDGGGALTKTGAGTLTLNTANTYSGDTTISAGTLILGDAAAIPFGSGKGNVIVNGTLDPGDQNVSINGLYGSGTISHAGGGTNRILTVGNNDADGDFSGVIGHTAGGSSGLTKTGTGTQILSGINAYTAATTISGGVLQAVDGTGLPTGSLLQIRGGVLQSGGTFTRTVGTNAGNVNWGSLAANPVGGGFAAIGGALNIQLNNGTASLTWNGSSFVLTGQALIFGSSTADNLVDFQNGINLGSSGTNTRTITVVDNPNSTTDKARISGVISNTLAGQSLLKDGAGILELTNANTYSGTTAVNAGTLLVNNTTGSGTGTGAVTVNNSGTILGGSGAITGSVSVASGANLSPGATGVGSTATLKTGALTLSSGSFFNADINNTTAGSGYDQLSVTGTVSISGSNLVVNAGSGLSLNQKFFVLLNDGTEAITGTFAQGTTVTANNGDIFSINYADNGDGGIFSNDISLTFQAVPEPSTWLAGALAFGAVVYTQRRRFIRHGHFRIHSATR